MAFLDTPFDVNELPQGDSNYELVPAGWYNATITKAEIKSTKAGTGQYIAIRYDITGPSHQGRVCFGNLNIKNPNSQAEEIGRKQLGEVMRAIGLARVTDTDQLIGGSLQIKISIKEADGQYEASNEIKGFKAINGSQPPMPAQNNGVLAAHVAVGEKVATVSTSAPPWAKK